MKLTILQPVRHDGRLLQPGDSVSIKDAAAARTLVAVGAAEGADESAKRAADAAPAGASDEPEAQA